MQQTDVKLRPNRRVVKELPDNAYEEVLRDPGSDDSASVPATVPDPVPASPPAVYPDFGAAARQDRQVKGSKTVRLEPSEMAAVIEMAEGLTTTESKLMATFISCVAKQAYPVFKAKGPGGLHDFIAKLKQGEFSK